MPLLLIALLAGPTRAAPVPDDYNADVVASLQVAASPDRVIEVLGDLRNQEPLLADCTRKWQHGDASAGVGASAQLVYKVGLWRRKLVGTITEVSPGRRVVVDHAGNKGFITTWTVTEADGQSQVELRTLLNLAPKPFRKIYVNRVQPAWQTCYATALVRLDEKLRE